MKKVILFFIVSFIIITFVIPLSSYAADIESGDIIKITKLTRRYERKINQGEQRYSLVMVGSFSKGDQITFKSNLTYEAYNIDSSVSELKGKDLVLVSFKGVEYVIIRDKNFERLGKGPTSSSGITGSVSGIGGGGSDGNNEEIFYESEDAGLEYDENASQSDINDAREEKKEEEENNDPDEIYTSQPSKDNEERTAGNSIDDLISDADAGFFKCNV